MPWPVTPSTQHPWARIDWHSMRVTHCMYLVLSIVLAFGRIHANSVSVLGNILSKGICTVSGVNCPMTRDCLLAARQLTDWTQWIKIDLLSTNSFHLWCIRLVTMYMVALQILWELLVCLSRSLFNVCLQPQQPIPSTRCNGLTTKSIERMPFHHVQHHQQNHHWQTPSFPTCLSHPIDPSWLLVDPLPFCHTSPHSMGQPTGQALCSPQLLRIPRTTMPA